MNWNRRLDLYTLRRKWRRLKKRECQLEEWALPNLAGDVRKAAERIRREIETLERQ